MRAILLLTCAPDFRMPGVDLARLLQMRPHGLRQLLSADSAIAVEVGPGIRSARTQTWFRLVRENLPRPETMLALIDGRRPGALIVKEK